MALVATAWGGLLGAGVTGLLAVREQHVPNYPATGQIILYAAAPATALTIVAVSAISARKRRWFYDVYPFVVGGTGFFMLPVMFYWTGGM